ncbi:MAG: polysaccharide biosynthesis C-terminal domain-containing protein [Bacteroidetes bacterium]|nr:polysaccharide biosynthesis C-terminal domain-containing protein [Bacteroidota bacterium]
MINKILNTFSIKFLSAICNLLIAVLVSRYLGKFGKGEQSIVLTTISLILIFVNIAGGATLVFLTPRYNLRKLITLSYIWSLFVALIFYFILSFTKIVNPEFIGHICLLSLIISFAAINANILLGKEKVNTSNFVNLVQPVITLLALFFFFIIVAKIDVMAYINALYMAYLFSFILSIVLLKNAKNKQLIKNDSWKDTLFAMFSLGFYNQISHIISLLNARLSYYLLDKYYGAGQLGIYSNGVSLTEAVWMVSGSMAMVQYAHIVNATDNKTSQQLTAKLTKISLLISLLIMIFMVLLPSEFYSFVFGKEFVNINIIMLFLAPGVILWNFLLLIGHYFSGTGKFYIGVKASSVGLIVTLLLSFWLIPRFGFYGAAVVTSISYIFTSMVVVYYFKKESGLGLYDLIPNVKDIKLYVLSLKNTLIVKNSK